MDVSFAHQIMYFDTNIIFLKKSEDVKIMGMFRFPNNPLICRFAFNFSIIVLSKNYIKTYIISNFK